MQDNMKFYLPLVAIAVFNLVAFYWFLIKSDQDETIRETANTLVQSPSVDEMDEVSGDAFNQERDVIADTTELKMKLKALLERQDWSVTQSVTTEKGEDIANFVIHQGKGVRFDHEGGSDIIKSGKYYHVDRGRNLWSGDPNDFVPERLYFKQRIISDDVRDAVDYRVNSYFIPRHVQRKIDWIERFNEMISKMPSAKSKYTGWKKTSHQDFTFQLMESNGEYKLPGGSEGSFSVHFNNETGERPKLILTTPKLPDSSFLTTITLDFSPVENLQEALRFPSEATETFEKIAGFPE